MKNTHINNYEVGQTRGAANVATATVIRLLTKLGDCTQCTVHTMTALVRIILSQLFYFFHFYKYIYIYICFSFGITNCSKRRCCPCTVRRNCCSAIPYGRQDDHNASKNNRPNPLFPRRWCWHVNTTSTAARFCGRYDKLRLACYARTLFTVGRNVVAASVADQA